MARGRSTRSATADEAGLRRRRVLRDLAVVGLLAGTSAALVVGYAWFRIGQQGGRDDQRPVGAIVVLGAAQYDGRPSAVFAARLDHAVALYLAGLAPYFVVTGGKLEGDRTTEAGVARAYAIDHGVPADHILMESEGRSTLQSIRSVSVILRDRGVQNALFVSDRSHMLRVLIMARDQGMIAYGSPTPTSPSDTHPGLRLSAMLHELGGLGLYFLTGDSSTGDFGPPAALPPPGPAATP